MSALWLSLFVAFTFIIVMLTKRGGEPQKSINAYARKLSLDNIDFFSALLIVSFSLFCCTRVMTSPDTSVYYAWYNKLLGTPFAEIGGTYGILFEGFSKLLSVPFQDNFRLYLFSLTFFNMFAVYKILRKMDGVGVYGFALYIYFVAFFYNFAVLRQGLAFTFVIWGFASWHNKKKLCILLTLAVLCHNTAIIVLLVAFLLHFYQFNKTALTIVSSISLINYICKFSDVFLGQAINFLGKYVPHSMASRYALYFINGERNSTVSIYYLVLFLVILALIQEVYGGCSDKGYSFAMDRIMLNIGAIGLVILSFGSAFTVTIRIADYFILPCIIFLTPSYANKFKALDGKILISSLNLIALMLYLRIFLNQAPLFL